MTFTQEEEQILKLIAAEVKARQKLNIENQAMGDEIRAQFDTIDAAIRSAHKPIFEPLQQDLVTAQTALKDYFKV